MTSLCLHFYSFRGHADSQVSPCTVFSSLWNGKLLGRRQLMNFSHFWTQHQTALSSGWTSLFQLLATLRGPPPLGKYSLSVQTVGHLLRFSITFYPAPPTLPRSPANPSSLAALCSLVPHVRSACAGLHSFVHSSSDHPVPKSCCYRCACLPDIYFLTSGIFMRGFSG